jgi:hypothetical protein
MTAVSYEGHKQKASIKSKDNSTKCEARKLGTLKGAKLSTKYRNPQDPNKL